MFFNLTRQFFALLFLSFSLEMQNALPVDKTKEFLAGLKQQAGKITKREFVKYEQTYASYKTNFEKALFAINISVDNNSKINGLLIKPFKESNLPKIERNKTKMVEAMYNRIPYNVCCCRSSSKISFFKRIKICFIVYGN